jgi:hypothetical protein
VSRIPQVVLIVSMCALSWMGAMAVHEFGHVVGAWLTGGHVERVVLHPLAISRTDVRPNPQPLVVAWLGPVVGCLLPLILALALARLNEVARDLARFFAGVCLVVNGLYLAVGSFWRIGDAGDLLVHGAERWQLWAFGAFAAPFGVWLWNGLGPTFGFGIARGQVSRRAACTCAAMAIIVAIVEAALAAE